MLFKDIVTFIGMVSRDASILQLYLVVLGTIKPKILVKNFSTFFYGNEYIGATLFKWLLDESSCHNSNR